MTVGQLIAKLAALPEDMEIQVITEYRQDPVDIVTLTRGSWSDDTSDDDDLDDEDVGSDDGGSWCSMIDEEPEFVEKDNGNVAVIVTW